MFRPNKMLYAKRVNHGSRTKTSRYSDHLRTKFPFPSILGNKFYEETNIFRQKLVAIGGFFPFATELTGNQPCIRPTLLPYMQSELLTIELIECYA